MSNIPYNRCHKCGHHLDPQYGCGCITQPVAPVEANSPEIPDSSTVGAKEKERIDPCPFCGEEPEETHATDRTYFYVGCANENCAVQPETGLEASKELARRAWKWKLGVAESKPTPSTPKCALCGTLRVEHAPEGHEFVQPQPDSSSISTEQTFEEWLASAKEYSYYQKQLIESSNILILRLFKECWNVAKGQRNGR